VISLSGLSAANLNEIFEIQNSIFVQALKKSLFRALNWLNKD